MTEEFKISNNRLEDLDLKLILSPRHIDDFRSLHEFLENSGNETIAKRAKEKLRLVLEWKLSTMFPIEFENCDECGKMFREIKDANEYETLSSLRSNLRMLREIYDYSCKPLHNTANSVNSLLNTSELRVHVEKLLEFCYTSGKLSGDSDE